MRSLQTICNLESDSNCLSHREFALLLNVFFQSNAVYKFHHNIVHILFLSDIIDSYNIRMG